MSLVFEKLDAYFENKEKKEKQELLAKIKKVQDRLNNTDKAIEELQYERDLIFGNLCSIISNDLKNSVFNIFRGFTSDICWKAWRWCHYKDNVNEELTNGKLTKDEYEQYKACFDMTVRLVSDYFFGKLKDEVIFKEIIKNWAVGYDYVYTYKDQEITIFIPNFLADETTWHTVLDGYRVNYKESEYFSGFVCSGLDYKKVAKELQEWMLAEGWNKGE